MIRAAASDRQLMVAAVAVSLAVHAALLALRFVPPSVTRTPAFDSRLPVILVNVRSDAMPLRAAALAQASLDGGGTLDAGRARSPLSDRGQVAEGRLLDAQQRRVAELERRQLQLLALLKRRADVAAGAPLEQPTGLQAQPTAEPSPALARRQAEIASDIADYHARPLKRQLGPNAREVPYALYYTALRKKIEQAGTLHFPQNGGAKLYGDLIVSIPLRQDGSLYGGEGGPRVERSSGNPALDAAALAIVRRAAPFGPLPAVVAAGGRAQVWEIVTRFSFTREQRLETQPSVESRE